MAMMFLSYSSIDRAFCRRLKNDLEALGGEVWLDEQQIKPGKDFLTLIAAGMAQCEYLIVVLSTNSINSEWVKLELEFSLRHQTEAKICIIPIILEKVLVPDSIKTIDYIDFSCSYEGGLRDFKSCLEK